MGVEKPEKKRRQNRAGLTKKCKGCKHGEGSREDDDQHQLGDRRRTRVRNRDRRNGNFEGTREERSGLGEGKGRRKGGQDFGGKGH